MSGRLHRPWSDLRSAALPPLTLAALCAAIAFCFVGGLPAILARIIAAALTIAYALAGFAVLHTLTLGLKNRALWLSCTYVIVVMFSWPVLAMAALGIADAVLGIRRRYLQGRPPPLPAS
jgi:mannose/fructose/N-acetylgalactosamine-specific phosphotransferase system component IIC